MGLRQVLFNLLNRGTPQDADPEATIEIADVPLSQGPLLVQALETNGIAASGVESYDLATGVRTRMRIMIRQGAAQEARAIVDDVTTHDSQGPTQPR
ncbi:MAG: hypothetical protein QOD92_4344 [Acidimicrobiaceae bacterium]|jgi:hypothetical protein